MTYLNRKRDEGSIAFPYKIRSSATHVNAQMLQMVR